MHYIFSHALTKLRSSIALTSLSFQGVSCQSRINLGLVLFFEGSNKGPDKYYCGSWWPKWPLSLYLLFNLRTTIDFNIPVNKPKHIVSLSPFNLPLSSGMNNTNSQTQKRSRFCLQAVPLARISRLAFWSIINLLSGINWKTSCLVFMERAFWFIGGNIKKTCSENFLQFKATTNCTKTILCSCYIEPVGNQ